MKIVEEIAVIDKGPFARGRVWHRCLAQVRRAIRCTDWPHGSGRFTIYPESGKKRGMGNGVLPIKYPCIRALGDYGWRVEGLPAIPDSVLTTGDLDALWLGRTGNVGFEWETGNVSSSHRALNKLVLTILLGGLKGGILVVPSRKLAQYLTDRIGNVDELRAYFRLWNSVPVKDGALAIVVVEQDGESLRVRRIPKGTDGRALA